MNRKYCNIISTIIVIAFSSQIVLFLMTIYFNYFVNGNFYRQVTKIHVGSNANQLISVLNNPNKILGQGESYIEGYSHPNRNITFQVYVYYGGMDSIVYIFIDHNKIVEDIFIGGS